MKGRGPLRHQSCEEHGRRQRDGDGVGRVGLRRGLPWASLLREARLRGPEGEQERMHLTAESGAPSATMTGNATRPRVKIVSPQSC